jgi:hypothetical protein
MMGGDQRCSEAREAHRARAARRSAPDTPAHETGQQGPLGVAGVLALQRAAGNRAVTHLRHSSGRAPVQRNGKSAAMLTNLAKPQVFAGPTVEVQNDIVTGLETAMKKERAQLSEYDQKTYDIEHNPIVLGGIELTGSLDRDVRKLIKGATFIPLENRKVAKASSFDLVEKAGVAELIVINTLATMDRAGQLDYLRESGLIGEDWKVVVEVHYYRSRNKGQTKFHKDTSGETLFVNLNFVNDRAIPGPEYIINPHSTADYQRSVEEKLPKVFVDDLKPAMAHYGEDQVVGMTSIPKGGVVAFVDEAMHHKTPTVGHRTAPLNMVAPLMQAASAEDYKDAEQAYKQYKGRGWTHRFTSYSSYLKRIKPPDDKPWLRFMTKLDTDEAPAFDRHELADIAKALPRGTLDIDRLIEEGGAADFGNVSFGHVRTGPRAGHTMEVKRPTQRYLKREMSDPDLRKLIPKQLPEDKPRTFFRTWVRAVRIAKATPVAPSGTPIATSDPPIPTVDTPITTSDAPVPTSVTDGL